MLHAQKDAAYVQFSWEHRNVNHPLYMEARQFIREGFSFDEVFTSAISTIKEFARKEAITACEEKGLLQEKARTIENLIALWLWHDIVDLVWDELDYKARRALEAAIREVWLNPRDFPNLFLSNTWDAYFASPQYEAQRRYLAELNYEGVEQCELQKRVANMKAIQMPTLDKAEEQ